jgi:hypothetical protein
MTPRTPATQRKTTQYRCYKKLSGIATIKKERERGFPFCLIYGRSRTPTGFGGWSTDDIL